MAKENIKKKRLDLTLFERGFTESRNKAQSIIMAGLVYINGVKIDKPGTLVDTNSGIEIKSNKSEFVSRGGLKLKEALNHFKIDVNGLICLDIGASTGGFTDCLLKRGAKKIYAFDVGHGQLDWNIRNHDKVVVREKINCRYITKDDLGEPVDLITVDVSFISLSLILKPAVELLKSGGKIIALIKPQFEVGKGEVGKGGIVKDSKLHKRVVENISLVMEQLSLNIVGVIESPIYGTDGNKEFLMFAHL